MAGGRQLADNEDEEVFELVNDEDLVVGVLQRSLVHQKGG
jgi:hypothetical protein